MQNKCVSWAETLAGNKKKNKNLLLYTYKPVISSLVTICTFIKNIYIFYASKKTPRICKVWESALKVLP